MTASAPSRRKARLCRIEQEHPAFQETHAMFSVRLSRRLLRHHLPFALLTIGSGVALYLTRPFADVITRLSFSSAYPALGLIAATLLIGPLKLWSGERLAVSIDLRRDIGIWAGLAGTFHAVIGQCVHLRGRPWLYYVYENWRRRHVQPFRHDMFGLANYTGLAAALILLLLLATSNDASLRKLGTPGWKQLQRWNYAVFGLTAIHTFAYQMGIESPHIPFIGLAVAAIATTLVLQWIGYRRRLATKAA
jgi:sulfoxide reductase heme-binding subunit YedZ